ncbi:ATP-binding protein [Streptomyces sp. NBC_01304]|uniref:ATP-binding protein n=1 Tax=Streptomyces sp. NBC_01304 TaxID=2903818 RepID=UPI002E104D61|nr:ATP-binding protein [Streptomyces sp. NBC_01304]
MEVLLSDPGQGTPGSTAARNAQGQLDMSFNICPRDLGFVRRVIATYMTWWHVGDHAAWRMAMAVNELLTNVLQHTEADEEGRRLTRLLVQQVPDGVTAIVSDQDTQVPVHAVASLSGESGRGWHILRDLADETSVTRTTTGKDIWLFIADPPPAEQP